MELYPMIMDPSFAHGSDTPWGGETLRNALMKDAPTGPVGISYEASSLEGCESLVGNGKYAAMTLPVIARKLHPDVFGNGAESLPVQVCLLDVAGTLKGKTETGTAWVVLNKEPESAFALNGQIFEPLPGDVFYLPAGTEYDLSSGVLLYAASGASSHAGTAGKNEGTTVLVKGGSITYYIADDALEFCRVNLDGTMPLPAGRMLVLTATAPCRICWGDEEALDLAPFATAVIPASLENVRLQGRSKLLMACLSQQEELRTLLNYRAENVSGLKF